MSEMDDASDFEDSEMDEDSYNASSDGEAFDEPEVAKQESTFDVLDSAACQTMAQQRCVEISELLCTDLETSQTLLRHFRWDKERLTEAYMTDMEKTAAKAGIHLGEKDESIVHVDGCAVVGGARQPVGTVMKEIRCEVCYETTTNYSALACGHAYCNECYATYITHKINDEGHECVNARCPAEKCNLLLSGQLVTALVPEEKLDRYRTAANICRSFVDDSQGIKWCRSDCGRAIRAQTGVLGVKCECGTRFCFHCSEDDHAPASCADLKRWLIKCKDDSETFNWLVANTKACPKCSTSIEKNGGCNHMTCRNTSCKHEFCWVCGGPWKDHSGSFYACNKYDPEKDKDKPDAQKKDSSRQALERYLHYYTRYTNHDNSLKLELQARTAMEEKIREMEKLGSNTWMDCLYLSDANEALHECRYALKFTYVYAFYLPQKATFRDHFEMQQMELEKQTEDLAEQLEKPVEDINRMSVVDAYQMAKKRLRHLFEIVEAQGVRGEGSSSTDNS